MAYIVKSTTWISTFSVWVFLAPGRYALYGDHKLPELTYSHFKVVCHCVPVGKTPHPRPSGPECRYGEYVQFLKITNIFESNGCTEALGRCPLYDDLKVPK